MSLTPEEKIACSELYYAATGEILGDHLWNEKAAEILYELIYELSSCSRAFAWITNFPAFPITSKSIGSASFKAGYYLYQVWVDYKKNESAEKFNARCQDVGVTGRYPTLIRVAMMGEV